MGWALGGFTIIVLLLLAVGAAFVYCRRYPVGWQCGARDVWIICEEWRRKLAWLWAPREEKVGLVKAQHPTAQAVPGLYRQSSNNSSQYIMHSDSDLRLDAQGAFTRFEAVDRDLQLPSGMLASPQQQQQQQQINNDQHQQQANTTQQQQQQTNPQNNNNNNNIPPQPLRPAPQPRATARPRPSPLRAPSSIDYLRLRECELSPLTPPPPPPPAPGKHNRAAFHFQTSNQTMESPSPPPLPPPPNFSRVQDFNNDGIRRNTSMVYQQTGVNHHNRLGNQDLLMQDDTRKMRYGMQSSTLSEPLFDTKDTDLLDLNTGQRYGSYDLINEARNYDAIFGSQDGFIRRVPSSRNLQDLERITRYIQSLPDVAPDPPSPTGGFFDRAINDEDEEEEEDEDEDNNVEEDEDDRANIAAPPPPPPAPFDPSPSNEQQQEQQEEQQGVQQQEQQEDGQVEPTTGEKIFKALRAVTSQSYIDASEFYNSILSSAQHVQNLAFTSSPIMDNEKLDNSQQENTNMLFPFGPPEVLPRKTSDLFSPELNQEAHRTAQQVYNSLQDPPASPLLLKDVDQQPYSYLSTDPSFTRTSEDIFNSLEHNRRKSVQERLNGFHDLLEFESTESTRRRNSLELLSAIEEMQLRHKLSQLFDECRDEFQHDELPTISNGTLSRRNSLGPEPEPPPATNTTTSLNLFDDFASLQRAISCESVCSDTSVALNDLEAGIEEPPVVGLICIGLELDSFAKWSSHLGETDLIVSVLEARDLIAPDGRPAQNTFARVCLLPDRQTHVQTRLYKSTNSPSYQEKFYFPLVGGTVGRILLVEVFSYEMPDEEDNVNNSGGESSLLGEASLRLGPSLRPATTWLPLVSPLQPIAQLGELLFSLSYLPTAERLTLVIVKARNLKGANDVPGDFFVKVYLLQQGKKMNKKRTTIKRGEKSPIFNEALIFSVPTHALQNVQLRLTVAEVSGDLGAGMKAYSVGHVIVGSTTTGRSLVHWKQMLTMLRRPVPMWHPLRK